MHNNLIKLDLYNFSPGGQGSSHGCISKFFPLHLPKPAEQVRTLVISPLPHGSLHDVHSAHMAHSPPTKYASMISRIY